MADKGSPMSPAVPVTRFIVGIEAVCPLCGQVRAVFTDGLVVIKVEGKGPIDEDVSTG